MTPFNIDNASKDCDPQRVKDFLESDHYNLGDAELIAHLDECPACRERVETQAGDAAHWSLAARLLRPDEFDQAGTAEFSAATCCESLTSQPAAVKEVLDSLVPSEDPNHLGRLGTYEVTGVVGVGGMGVVLKAIDPSLDRVVALKVMSPRLANNENARKRFAREAKAAAAVLHPNVIPIHSVSSGTKLPFLVMSYIRGGSLQKRIEKEGPLPLVEVLRIGSQIAAGLQAAHEQGLVHRDIKPENILLEEGVERVTITDFGLARSVDDNTITQFGAIAGTPRYMSPEQARGEQLDQQSDLFSLGSVLYALCTGRPPFRDDSSYGVMRKIIDDNPVQIDEYNPEIPRWMVVIVAKLMSKQKSKRFASATEVRNILDACLGHVQQPQSISLPEFPALSHLCVPASPQPIAKGSLMKKVQVIPAISLLSCLMLIPFYQMTIAQARKEDPNKSTFVAQFRAAENITNQDQRDQAFAQLATNAAAAGDGLMTTRALENIVRQEIASPKRRDCSITLFQSGKLVEAHTMAESIYYRHDKDAALAAFVGVKPEQVAVAQTVANGAEQTNHELAAIQGAWQVTYSEDSGRQAPQEMLKQLQFVFTESKLLTEVGGQKSEATFVLDANTNPKSIDLTENGRTKLGIYDLEGDTLRICFAEESENRPTAFDSKPNSVNDIVIMLKRIEKATNSN